MDISSEVDGLYKTLDEILSYLSSQDKTTLISIMKQISVSVNDMTELETQEVKNEIIESVRSSTVFSKENADLITDIVSTTNFKIAGTDTDNEDNEDVE